MAKKRKSIIRKIAENRKVRRAVLIVAIVFAVVCLGSAIFDGAFRSSAGISGFNKEYSEVPSNTRDALKSELDRFVLLNTGESQTRAGFKLREGSASEIQQDKDGNKSSSFYIDSEKLHISAFVQIVWNAGFSTPDTSFIARISCASEDMRQYKDQYCYSPSTSEKARAVTLENLGLLEDYRVSAKTVEAARGEMLDYLKIAYPEADSALIKRSSIRREGSGIYAELMWGKQKMTLETAVDSDFIILKKNNSEIWSKHLDDEVSGYRHYLVLEKQLPAEIKTVAGTSFLLQFVDENHLVINSASCAEGDKNDRLIRSAKSWLKDNNFNPEAFEIKLKINCES